MLLLSQLYHSHLVATNQQKTLKLQKLKQKLQSKKLSLLLTKLQQKKLRLLKVIQLLLKFRRLKLKLLLLNNHSAISDEDSLYACNIQTFLFLNLCNLCI